MSRTTRAVICVVAVAIVVVIGVIFLTRFSPPRVVLERVIPAAAAALLVAAASMGIGALIVDRGRPARVADETSAVPEDEFLIGVPIYGTLLALLAIAGIVSPIVLFVLTVLSASYGALTRWRAVATLFASIPWGRTAILLPPIAIALIGALAPVNTPDELVYKLAVPKTYLLFGRMLELPLNSNSYFPSAVYMADLGALVLYGGAAAKLLHFLIYLTVLRVVYRLSSRLSGDESMWPTAVIAWTPALAIIAGWAWAEWAMIGLVLLSLLRWEDFLDSDRRSDLVIAAAALGGALATKYTALPWLAVFIPIALWRTRRWRVIGTAALIVAAIGGFFYVRNVIWTGSPIAPFLLPNSPSVTEYRSAAGGWTELLLGYDILHAKIIDDSLGILTPAMVLLSPLALLWRNRRVVDTFVIGAAQLAILVTIAPTSRLIVLAVVPLAILGAIAIARVCRHAVFAVVAGIAFFAQIMLVAFIYVTAWNFQSYLVGAESEGQYLQRTRDFYKPYAWINEHTNADAKLLLIAENRTFHLERRAIAAGNLDGPRVAAYLARFRTQDALRQELRSQGYTHVLVHRPWYTVGPPSGTPRMIEKEYVLNVTPETHMILRGFLTTHGRVVYQDGAYVLYEL